MSRKLNSYRRYRDSSYLRKEDFPSPEILTISEVCEEEVTAPGKKPKKKLIIRFEEIEKGMVCNMTNGDVLFEITGCEYPDDWVGVRVMVWHDPSVPYAGKRIGGLRLRKPTPAELGKVEELAEIPAEEAAESPY
jgi:hypothetical protein